MERINRIDPDEQAATQRLLIAVVLSLLLHGIAVWLGPGRIGVSDATALQASIVAPRVSTSSALLRNSGAAFDARPRPASSPTERSSVVSRLETPDPRYYPVEELDVLPMPRQPIRLRHSAPTPGKVRLLARIDASGRITGVSIFDSEATDTQASAAVNALRLVEFSAARKHGRPVRSEVVIELAGGSGTD